MDITFNTNSQQCFSLKKYFQLINSPINLITNDNKYYVRIKNITFGEMGECFKEIDYEIKHYKSEGKSTLTHEHVFRLCKVVGMELNIMWSNSEHISRYIFENRWISLRLCESGDLHKMISECVKAEKIKYINTRPNYLTMDQELEILSENEISDLLLISIEQVLDVKTDRVILIVGPTGSGKSFLVNKLLNQNVVKSSQSLTSETVDMSFINTFINNNTYTFLDTMGFCDTFYDDSKVLSLINNKIKLNELIVDEIWVVIRSRIEKDHISALYNFLKLLSFTSCFKRKNSINEIKEKKDEKNIKGSISKQLKCSEKIKLNFLLNKKSDDKQNDVLAVKKLFNQLDINDENIQHVNLTTTTSSQLLTSLSIF
jgi:GTPase SAR1 family protein